MPRLSSAGLIESEWRGCQILPIYGHSLLNIGWWALLPPPPSPGVWAGRLEWGYFRQSPNLRFKTPVLHSVVEKVRETTHKFRISKKDSAVLRLPVCILHLQYTRFPFLIIPDSDPNFKPSFRFRNRILTSQVFRIRSARKFAAIFTLSRSTLLSSLFFSLSFSNLSLFHLLFDPPTSSPSPHISNPNETTNNFPPLF
jgi:hypothetical protein